MNLNTPNNENNTIKPSENLSRTTQTTNAISEAISNELTAIPEYDNTLDIQRLIKTDSIFKKFENIPEDITYLENVMAQLLEDHSES